MSYELLRERINQLAQSIHAPAQTLPNLGISSDFGYSHIEIDPHGFHYIAVERGEELSHAVTEDIHELLYWVFRDVTFSMACTYESAHRNPAQDFRRILFAHQCSLLGLLDPTWQIRCAQEQEKVLTSHPYKD